MERTKKTAQAVARTLLVALALAPAAACTNTDPVENLRTRPHQRNAGVDWRDQVIYQVLVDRFDNGDPNNDWNIELGAPARYHGGDWRGLQSRLGYLEELGVTALWISPVVRNVEEDAGFASYHGYWAQDLVRPNPHFGDLMALRELVDAAHERGILVILDIVTNHMGQLFFYDINGNGRPDDTIMGAGVNHTCLQVCGAGPETDGCNPACSEGECQYCREGYTYFERVTEWDPEYDPRGVQGWTSLGFSGPAEIRFLNMPEINRTPPARPPSWFDWPTSSGWFDSPGWYNRRGRVYVWWHEWGYPHDFVRDQEVLGDFPGGLKDLNTDHPMVQDAMIAIFQHWITVADFDGFRIDTLKHIDRPEVDPNRRGFWGAFTDAMREHAASLGKENFFMFGEAFDGNDELIGAYTFPGTDEEGDSFGRLDSVFYFSQKFRVFDEVFKGGGATRNIECMYNARMGIAPDEGDSWCADHGFPAGPTYHDEPHASPSEGGTGLAPNISLVNFMDNHDLERFLYRDATVETLHNAMFFLLTWDGIPCIYYGTEQLFDGGNDPRNREDMFLGNPEQGLEPFDTSHDTFQHTAELIRLRREHTALRRGSVDITWTTDRPRGERDSGLLAFERVHDDGNVLVVINSADEQESETCAPAAEGGECMAVSFPAGTTLTDVGPHGDGYTVTVGSDRTVAVTVPARSGRILVAL